MNLKNFVPMWFNLSNVVRSPSTSSPAGSAVSAVAPARAASEDDSEVEGEFSPANSGVDPNFLRQIKKTADLSKLDQEVTLINYSY